MTPGEPDDRTLAAHAMAGHQDAYAALMRRHRDAVWRLARGHVGDSDEALDITQEVFIAAFAALARYDGARPFRAWIARITLNKCRDWGRRRAVRRFFAFARPIDEAGDIADVAPDPEAALQSQRELARINAAIAALPAPLKDVLLLRTIEAMSQADTAATLGLSEKAVETRLYRARAKLSESLRDDAAPRV
ncbi:MULTISPECIES: RNA polymerase sigma factor [unclassified Sphingobium]|uniref:RNA polymerase sigma factor n=1 Tax=unclassified Sphingobium TaxID=2611147 RepID=UPI000D179EA9|nr:MULTISPECIES: sigma-70 family RNA polymerase sigma factor [unclassified Sphingobium]MBG6120316.1 RNA polymerase sigma-70 factor (ECF subfamily) [Sphingobium sp. JAI105]PSO11051.1 RNA polymerase subunit sigma-24 [Sphingobium sp. AEW4]TWD05552.1 RNA polymerase sigma-70 factor (ECF subfamily) [Sphingobium sp. AEW010]TWD22437.1 RNA polymerase sigma-70 factor (ECF subfamily) [Sphingobium sp. AEW013]TWD25020.1 RNA polymerase sigma-70 factor (ECF subfamily) [Sphingobium sp. AEW001]